MTTSLGPDWPDRTIPVQYADLSIVKDIGEGAVGTVHEVAAQPPCYFKRYRTPSRHVRRLEQLIAWRRALPPARRDFLDTSCSWPLVAVADGDQTIGFLMRRAPEEFWANMHGQPHTLELQHLIHVGGAERLGIRLPTSQQRLELLRNFAVILQFFDTHQIVYGDVSEKNILWTLDGEPRVFLIDCDNAQIGPETLDTDGVAKPRNSSWRDPYLPADGLPTLFSDRYTLAVFCFRVFYRVNAALDREQMHVFVPDPIPGLPDLERYLGRGLGAPKNRPSAAEWVTAIGQPPLPLSGDMAAAHTELGGTGEFRSKERARALRPRKRPRGQRRVLILTIAATVMIIASGGGLLAAHPWVHPPVLRPTGLTIASDVADVSGTTDNVEIVWSGPPTGPLPDEYEILRDGKEIATVPGTRTSYTDNGLTPNETHNYQVIATRGGKQSLVSVTLTAQTTPLQPTGLTVQGETTSSLEIVWSDPEPASPPEEYEILRDGNEITTVPGDTTSYTDSGLAPDTAYTYQVIAVTGSVQSQPSETLASARTDKPPLSAAVLDWTGTVTEKMTSIYPADSSWNDQPGASWADSWTFSTSCSTGPCHTATLTAFLAVDTSGSGSGFRMTLTRSGTTYTGTVQVKGAAYCVNSSDTITGTLTTKITVTAAAAKGNTWSATSFTGESTLYTPAEYTCGAETVMADVKSR